MYLVHLSKWYPCQLKIKIAVKSKGAIYKPSEHTYYHTDLKPRHNANSVTVFNLEDKQSSFFLNLILSTRVVYQYSN